MQLFLPKYGKCNSVRIDYYYVDMIIAAPKPKIIEKSVEEQKEDTSCKKEMEILNVGDKKKYESMTDE